MPQEAAMSTNHHASRLFAFALIALLLGAGGFGYWRSTQDRLPDGLSILLVSWATWAWAAPMAALTELTWA